ncbi:MAG TPA: hypothetical protein VNP73_05440 [Actinomycetota bacterium]|nr:hypothetical protein [Actinomycetota bacterium]
MKSPAVRILLALALLVGLPGAPAVAAPIDACAMTSQRLVYVYSLHIEAKPGKKAYRRGDKVKVLIRVTRPAEEDPAGQGQQLPPTVSEPAEGATVGGIIWVGDDYSWDQGAITDANGEAVLNIPTRKNFDVGMARADFVAEIVHYNNNGCPDVRELGYRSYENFVRITP